MVTRGYLGDEKRNLDERYFRETLQDALGN